MIEVTDSDNVIQSKPLKNPRPSPEWQNRIAGQQENCHLQLSVLLQPVISHCRQQQIPKFTELCPANTQSCTWWVNKDTQTVPSLEDHSLCSASDYFKRSSSVRMWCLGVQVSFLETCLFLQLYVHLPTYHLPTYHPSTDPPTYLLTYSILSVRLPACSPAHLSIHLPVFLLVHMLDHLDISE